MILVVELDPPPEIYKWGMVDKVGVLVENVLIQGENDGGISC